MLHPSWTGRLSGGVLLVWLGRFRRPRQISRAVAALSGVLVVGGAAAVLGQQRPLMSLPGSFEVTEAGAASYAIPIQVPPGAGGIEPKLSLVYRSQGSNGLLGVGWSLVGLSEIARCPRTIAQDGVRGSVNLNANDRFCLDGQRLIVVAGGSYGAAGTQYRTELETFAEVKASTTMAGSGPASFTVRTKSGLIMEYGTTTDSRIEAPGKPEARIWALSKVSDRHGNTMTITYTEESGSARPARIDYTTNPSQGVTAAPLSVRFTYETRTDTAPAGNRRLSKIGTYLNDPAPNGTLVAEYRLTYGYGPVTARSRVTQIQRCDGTTPTPICLPATTFGYSDTAAWMASGDYGRRLAASDFAGASAADWQNDALYPRTLADVNGDGRVDVVRFAANGVWIAFSNGGGFFTPARWHTGFGTNDGYLGRDSHPRMLADVNADGLPDIVGFKAGNVYVALGTGSGFGAATLWLSGHPAWTADPGSPPRNFPKLVDLNGDGFADLLTLGTSAFVNLSTGASFGSTQTWHSEGVKYFHHVYVPPDGSDNFSGCSYTLNWTEIGAPTLLADADGDGLPDIFWFNKYLSGGSAPSIKKTVASAFSVIRNAPISVGCSTSTYWPHGLLDPPLLGDINGDGRADAMYFDVQRYYEYNESGQTLYTEYGTTASGFLGDGNGGLALLGSFPHGGYGGASNGINAAYLMDINGDGLADLVTFTDYGVRYSFSTGYGFGAVQTWINQYGALQGWASHPRRLADVDGDGRPDIVGFGSDGVYTTRSASLPLPDLIVSISSGLGASRTVSYETLSQVPPAGQAPVYTKGSGSLYPHVDLRLPLAVVRQTAVSNGIGGVTTIRYNYGELRGEATGRGMKGFRWVEALQVETNLRVRTEYSQDFPFTGSPVLIERQVLNAAGQVTQVISRVTNTYGCFDFAGATPTSCQTYAGRRYFPYLRQSVEEAWDLNGAAMPTVTTTTEYNEPTTAFFGNATKVTVQTSAGGNVWTRETTNTYSNDAANWILGRLTQSVVQSTTPN